MPVLTFTIMPQEDGKMSSVGVKEVAFSALTQTFPKWLLDIKHTVVVRIPNSETLADNNFAKVLVRGKKVMENFMLQYSYHKMYEFKQVYKKKTYGSSNVLVCWSKEVQTGCLFIL